MAEVKVDELAETIEVDAPVGGERRDRQVHKSGLEGGHENEFFRGGSIFRSGSTFQEKQDHQPCGSVSRMPSSSSWRRIWAWRSGLAVGSGGRVGPTGRPMITMPPLSEDGYWLRNSAHSLDTLY